MERFGRPVLWTMAGIITGVVLLFVGRMFLPGSDSARPGTSPTTEWTVLPNPSSPPPTQRHRSPTATKTETPRKAAESTAPTAQGSPAAARIVFFRVSGEPKCEVVATSTTPARPAVPIRLSWKVVGADHVGFSDDEPNYFESHGGRAGKRGIFPTVHTEAMEFFCNDGEATTHEYTINTMGPGPSEKLSIKFTMPAAA